MKILLLGADGQIGWELRRALAPLGTVVAMGRRHTGDQHLDLSDLDALAQTVRKLAPNVVVNAAAYTAVDAAETNENEARIVNALAPARLAEETAKLDGCLVHYSTDYVFDGSGNRPWREIDTPAPLNVYGATKLEGEVAIRATKCRHLIIRTSWIYAARGHNFMLNILRLAAEKDHLRIVNDQVGAPTGAELIADITAQLVPTATQNPRLTGTYHVAASGETSWHGYAQFIVERARALGWPLLASAETVEAVSGQDFETPARRPGNSRLDCTALSSTFGLYLPDWHVGVERVLTELHPAHGDAS